ncbi:trypsin-like serine protease [Polyangium sp. y55x31]|uniref:trypsin-like serine protease n=1 Tax=Polyangium sp. y55x31 TaxID=3042688 RepID=UPI0024829EC6|nr:trypsin-like serine protease [Polyangium sp. y55x31]MDI1475425.1 trypsin-like serine protease [Polyangium sp. y55x31]
MNKQNARSRWTNTLSLLAALVGAFAASGCVAENLDEVDGIDEVEGLDEEIETAEQEIVNGAAGFAKKASYTLYFDHGAGTPYSRCTGVALTTNWLLTAAHCVYDANGALYTRAFAQLAGDVAQVVPHPAFAPYAASTVGAPSHIPDVALLRLVTPLNAGSINCASAPDDCWRSPAGMPIPLGVTSSGYAVTSYFHTFDWALSPEIVCDGIGGMGPSNGTFDFATTYPRGTYYQTIPRNGNGQTMTFGDSGGACYFKTGARNQARLLSITSSGNVSGGQTMSTNVVVAGKVATWIDSVIPTNDRVLVVPDSPGAGL